MFEEAKSKMFTLEQIKWLRKNWIYHDISDSLAQAFCENFGILQEEGDAIPEYILVKSAEYIKRKF